MKRLVGLLVIALTAVVAPATPADAQDVLIDDGVVEAASNVVSGVVGPTVTVELDGQPHQVSELHISDSLVGSLSGTVLVQVPGGPKADGTVLHVSHVASLVPGDQVQIALAPVPQAMSYGLAVALQSEASVFSVVGGSAGAMRLLPTGTYEAAAVGDFSLSGARWSSFAPPVEYYVNTKDSGLSAEATVDGVQRAFQMWEDDPDTTIDFTYAGASTKKGVDFADDQVVVSWINPPAGTIWLAQASWIATGAGDIISFDVRVSRNYQWANGASNGRYDISTVVGHEVGHGVGLQHASSSSDLMYHQIVSGSAKGLGPGDRSGIFSLYPAAEAGPVCQGNPVTVDLNTGVGSPSNGRDVILGTSAGETISGLGGNDVICGGGGDDTIYGGAGDDEIFGGQGNDTIYGGGGKDRVRGQNGNDTIHGGDGNDNLNGNNGDDTVLGQDGHDYVSGRDGRDRVEGGAGNDVVNGGGKTDSLKGGSGDDVMNGNGYPDQMWGGAGDDTMSGGDHDDVLHGEAGNDILKGNRDNDQLIGSFGFDDCDGLTGTDTSSGCESQINIP